MAVYKALRGESNMQFVETARQLAVYTRKYCLKMPKRYTFFGVQELCRLADAVYNEVKMANSIYIRGRSVRKEFSLADICRAYASWRSHMARGHNYWQVNRMDAFFHRLFGFHPCDKEAWRTVFERKEGITCTELETMLQAV